MLTKHCCSRYLEQKLSSSDSYRPLFIGVKTSTFYTVSIALFPTISQLHHLAMCMPLNNYYYILPTYTDLCHLLKRCSAHACTVLASPNRTWLFLQEWQPDSILLCSAMPFASGEGLQITRGPQIASTCNMSPPMGAHTARPTGAYITGGAYHSYTLS